MSWRSGRESVSVIAAMTIQKETVSRVLLALREQHKPAGSTEPLTQEKAAARVPDLTQRTWQRWEKQEVVPQLAKLEAVATAYQFPVTEFLDINDQDGATPSVLSLEEVREEFRGLVAGVNGKLDGITTDQAAVQDLVDRQNANLLKQTQVLESIVASQSEITAALASLPTVANALADLLQQLKSAGQTQRREGGGA